MADIKQARGRLMVLLALEDGPKHGYEVSKYLHETSGGFFSISFGSLYPVLHRLEKERLVTATWQEAGATRKKKVYALTRKGHKALRQERDDYEAFTVAFAKLMQRNV